MGIENLDIGLFNKVMDDVLAPPSEKRTEVAWNQQHWGRVALKEGVEPEAVEGFSLWMLPLSCNTAACVAGHIAMYEGWQPVIDRDDLMILEHGLRESVGYSCVTKDGMVENVEKVALAALGVSDHDLHLACGGGLFYEGNDEYTLKVMQERANAAYADAVGA